MPVTLELKENGRIVCLTASDDWTIEEILDLDPQLVDYLRHASHPVHLLVDVSQTDIIPEHFSTLAKSTRYAEPNLGYTAVVSDSFGLQLLSEIISKMVNYNKNRYFRSVDVAYTFLRSVIQDDQCPEDPKVKLRF